MRDATDADKAFAWAAMPMYMAAIPLNAILLATYAKHRRELLVHTTDYLFVLLLIIEFSWAASFIWVEGYSTIYLGGFDAASPQKDIACQIAAVLAIETAGNATTVHMLIALERLLTVVVGLRDSRPVLLAVLTAVEVLFAVLIAVQIHTARGFEPAEDRFYCFFPLVRTPGGGFAELAPTLAVMSYIVLASTITLGSYFYIYFVVIRSSRRVTSSTVGGGGPSLSEKESHDKREARNRETKVFFRCVGVVVAFASTYLPAFALLAYEIAASTTVPEWLNGIGDLLGTADTFIAPVMIMLLNRGVARAAAATVGVRLPHWMLGDGRHIPVHGMSAIPEQKRVGASTQMREEGEGA
ncbi:hypothetical protein HK101_006626 [Irineochytrium annulatum]|nr:hypothetical protein HK101_006626 [Irineochytrium annulatum]